MKINKISYVVPCYNEEPVLPEFYRRVSNVAAGLERYTFEFVFINDGSSDATYDILNEWAQQDDRVKVLHLARNLGHQNALTAGLDFATGDVIITLDADLQDPPELTSDILRKIEDGFDVVHMQRRNRKGEGAFKLFTAWGFYKLLKKLSRENIVENSGDFRAFTRPVLRTVQRFREHHRFIRGIFGVVGFRQTVVLYDRDERYSGETKYPVFKMLKLALNAFISFSTGPIQLISWLGVLAWAMSLFYLVDSIVKHFVYDITVPGWTSIIILLTFFAGIIIFCLSIIAAYVGKIFEQGQHRPLYWLSDVRNIEPREMDNSITEVRLFSDTSDK